MNNTFITSDLHLGEDRFEIMQRPFTTCDEHNQNIIANHNAVVAHDDLVYILGDVVYQKSPQYLPCIAQLNGHKILVRGNHDRVFTNEQLAPYFEKIVAEGDGIELKIGDLDCWLTHYPVQGKYDRFNIVGHIHAAWKFQLNMLNACVDVHHFRPICVSQVSFFFKAICEFYDNDVWCAYNRCNSRYSTKRGKKSSYLYSERK